MPNHPMKKMPLYPDRWTWLNSSIASQYDYQSLIIKHEIEAYQVLNVNKPSPQKYYRIMNHFIKSKH